ncbi:MAG: hypothetical protein HRU38_08510 [Saccharospirillaceae bacterium]|nr:hypothetical protein [Pseudomonadales bacterium]NRB78695.1 hypothetical protein [Saccharospirillaceae bacterium]
MSSKKLEKYFGNDNLQMRVSWLELYGHQSNVWGETCSIELEWVVEIVDSFYVSKPCWKEICEAADRIDSTALDLNMFCEWDNEPDIVDIYQFYFSDIEIAKAMALRVQSSARNKRKDNVRRIRLEKAGGFHDQSILAKLYEIQQGCCYFSGEPLIKNPKNYVIDHIKSIYKGGTNWPRNLALVLREINTWKGGHSTSAQTLKWLAKERGQHWLRNQKELCKEVDLRREALDKEFRNKHKINS